MKKDIHPQYRKVVFRDAASDFAFLGRSSIEVPEGQTVKWEDGNEYPLVKLEISSASDPHYTGKQKVIDTEGRIEKFKKKFGSSYMARKK